MPLINLPLPYMLLLLFTLTPFIQVSAALICRRIPVNNFNSESIIFRTHKFEKGGRIYKSIFMVHKWKRLLPDGAKYFKGDFTKKSMLSFDAEYIDIFVKESCRAELVHWLGMIPFIIYYLITPPLVATLMVVYAIISNAPCIITQRYNRPRLKAMLAKKYIEKKLDKK